MFKRIKQWFSTSDDSPTASPFNSFFNTLNYAGQPVTEKSVATHADAYTCIKILSSSIGSLSLKVYRDENGLVEEIKDTLRARIFTVKPCKYMNMQEWLEMAVACLALRGNFYCEVVRNRYGNVSMIVPFVNQRGVSVHQNQDGDLVYTYVTNDNKTRQFVKSTFSADQILHIKINSFDGILGTSPLTHCAQELGISIATAKHTESIFENDATPRAVIETDNSFGNNMEAFKRLKEGINEALRGADNSGKIAILEDGAKLKPIALTPVDAELLATRKLSREKVYAMYGVPISKANGDSKFSDTTEDNRAFLTDTLRSYMTHIESKLNELLPSNFSIKFDISNFIRADIGTMTEVVAKQFDHGFISLNEAREMLSHPSLDDKGDIYAVRTNNIIFGTIEDFTADRQPTDQTPPTQPQEESADDPEKNSV